jgi:hypothetical protein
MDGFWRPAATSSFLAFKRFGALIRFSMGKWICIRSKLGYGERLGLSLLTGVFEPRIARGAFGCKQLLGERGSLPRTRSKIFSQKAVASESVGGKIRAPFLQGFSGNISGNEWNPFKATKLSHSCCNADY